MADEQKLDTHINLKVAASEDGSEVNFKVKKTTPFKKLMTAYCEKVGKHNLKFSYDGVRLNDAQTPLDLDMEDGDTIEASIEQHGGF